VFTAARRSLDGMHPTVAHVVPSVAERKSFGAGFSCGVFRCQTGGPRPYDRYVAGNFVHEITGFVFSLATGC
jgi:hypothetical protein